MSLSPISYFEYAETKAVPKTASASPRATRPKQPRANFTVSVYLCLESAVSVQGSGLLLCGLPWIIKRPKGSNPDIYFKEEPRHGEGGEDIQSDDPTRPATRRIRQFLPSNSTPIRPDGITWITWIYDAFLLYWFGGLSGWSVCRDSPKK